MKLKELTDRRISIEMTIEQVETIINRSFTDLYIATGVGDEHEGIDIEIAFGKDFHKDVEHRLKAYLSDLKIAHNQIAEKLEEDFKIKTQTFEL